MGGGRDERPEAFLLGEINGQQRVCACSLPLLRRFFETKLHYYPEDDPKLPYVRPDFDEIVAEADVGAAIDRTLQASGGGLRILSKP